MTHNELQRIVDSGRGRERELAEMLIRERAAHADALRVRNPLLGTWGAAARADVIAVVMQASEHDTNPYRYRFWVDVTKNRFGTPQRAAFPTLEGAFDFIKRLGRPA